MSELWKNDIESLKPEMLNRDENIESFEIQNNTKIPCTVGDNKTGRKAQKWMIAYLNDRIPENQSGDLLN